MYLYHTKQYRSSESVCKNCPLRKECCGEKTKFKKLSHSIHKEYYDRMHKKLTENKTYAQRMSRLRSATVEPVLGTLINFLNMKRVNTRGIELANKHVLMASLTYNLKKYMKFIRRTTIAKTIAMTIVAKTTFSARFFSFLLPFRLVFADYSHLLWLSEIPKQKIIARAE
ncbi:MAG: transposase [Bacteroidales bacterium]|nr:transposase [Bacteroidales bacterium]